MGQRSFAILWLTALLVLADAGRTVASRGVRDSSGDSDSSAGTRRPDDDDSSAVENPPRCSADSEDYDFDLRTRTACKDENWIVFRNVPRSVCEEQCGCRSECAAFTQGNQGRDCFLKKSCILEEYHADDSSGIRRATPPPEPPTRCDNESPAEFEVKYNFACGDPNQRILRQISESNCQLQCSCTDWCIAYTYNGDRGDCYLKESCDQGGWHQSDRSGIKIDDNLYQVYENARCSNPTINFFTNSGKERCRNACTDNNYCQAFTFNTYTFECHLFNSCNTVWGPNSYTEIKQEAVPPNPPPSSGCSQGLPFGLNNCICDGERAGYESGTRACNTLKARCGFSLKAFDARSDDDDNDSDLLEDIQRICDSLNTNACLEEAREIALDDRDCRDLLTQSGAGICSLDDAQRIFQDAAYDICRPA